MNQRFRFFLVSTSIESYRATKADKHCANNESSFTILLVAAEQGPYKTARAKTINFLASGWLDLRQRVASR